MLYQNTKTLYITDGPCRQDLAMAWSFGFSDKNPPVIKFVDDDKHKRSAVIRSLEYVTNDQQIVKIGGQIAWQPYGDQGTIPNKTVATGTVWDKYIPALVRSSLMCAFTGTYNPQSRSGQFEVTYFTADPR